MACEYCYNGCARCEPSSNKFNAALKGFTLINPIPEEVSDPKSLQSFFKKYKYIPYAGYSHDSQHTYLRFLDNLSLLSPTLGGVISSIGHCAFGGKTKIKQVIDIDFDLGEDKNELSLESKKEYLAWLKTIDLGRFDWSSLKTALYKSAKSNGNIFVQVLIYQNLGQFKIKIKPLQTKECLYTNPDLFEGPNIAVSKSWDSKYIKDNPPEVIPVYPNYSNIEGVIKTIFHVKTGSNDFYGRPDWMPCIHDAFLEIKNKEYLLTAAHNMFTGKLILEVEEDGGNETILDNEQAKKDGFKSASHRFDLNFTNKGDDPSGVYLMIRPKGATPMTTHQISLNMNEKYYAETDRMTTDKIILANGWSRKLVGFDESAGGIGGNAFIDTLKTKMPLIEFWQDLIDNQVLNKILFYSASMTGKNDFALLGLESNNPFETLLETNIEIKPDATNNQP